MVSGNCPAELFPLTHPGVTPDTEPDISRLPRIDGSPNTGLDSSRPYIPPTRPAGSTPFRNTAS